MLAGGSTGTIQKIEGHERARGAYTEARSEHASRHDQVGKDEAGHAERQEDRFTGVCSVLVFCILGYNRLPRIAHFIHTRVEG